MISYSVIMALATVPKYWILAKNKVSDVRGCGYHIATMLGLFPAQLINVYLGSTLRSIHEVLDDSHVTGYIVFVCQILIGVTLMVWVVQKARKELTIAIMAAESISSSSSSTIS
ncbi:hypothetical protein evm_008001 [Chilo suppressalis]|nr:hypothetical protein evm_008001 [Chilo suppressalis]